MPQTNLGRVAFRFKGLYNSDSIYKKNDVVFDGESSFVSQVDNNIGNSLSDEINWALMAGGHNNDYRIIKAGSDSMTPSVPFAQKVLSNSGSIHSRSVANSMGYQYLDSIGNIKLLFCPQIGVKLRESGIYKYTEKLYGFGNINIDATQTTALNQPYLSGNIAPNEKYAIKNPNGGSSYMQHTPISFLGTDKWSVTTVISPFFNTNNDASVYCGTLGSISGLYIQNNKRLSLRFVNSANNILGPSVDKVSGKNIVLTVVCNNTSINFYIDGILHYSKDIVQGTTTFDTIMQSTNDRKTYGALNYYSIRNIALSPTQVQDEYNYLRSLFPEIESVQIGAQTWATSNCEMTCTPQGNVIPEMQAATNIERVVNGGFDTDNNWDKTNGITISDGNLNFTNVENNIYTRQINVIKPNTWYRYSINIKTLINGGIKLNIGGYQAITLAGSGINTGYTYAPSNSGTSFYIQASGVTTAVIDDVSVQEVGWTDSTNLYNYIYANTSGTAEQKEYAAIKAAAMWCYYNNDPAIGAVYGKLYNWYAVRLLQMDINYYNAANPTTPWGWRVPTMADFNTLIAYLGSSSVAGGKMKKEGTSYWNSPNEGADNSSGLSIIGAGRRGSISGGFANYKEYAILGTSDKSPSGAWGFGTQFDTRIINPSDYLVPPSDKHGFSLRLIKS